jgi:hypothetical protein
LFKDGGRGQREEKELIMKTNFLKAFEELQVCSHPTVFGYNFLWGISMSEMAPKMISALSEYLVFLPSLPFSMYHTLPFCTSPVSTSSPFSSPPHILYYKESQHKDTGGYLEKKNKKIAVQNALQNLVSFFSIFLFFIF